MLLVLISVENSSLVDLTIQEYSFQSSTSTESKFSCKLLLVQDSIWIQQVREFNLPESVRIFLYEADSNRDFSVDKVGYS